MPAEPIPFARRKSSTPAPVNEVHIIWITAGLGCDGDSVSVTNAEQPSIEDVLLGAIPGLPKVYLHNPVLAYEVGDDFMKYFYQAERGELDPFAPRLEHASRGLGRLLDQRPRLLVAPPAEAAGRGAALPVPPLDEARADLRRDQALALENADRVAAEADEQRRDEVVGRQRVEQRPELDPPVLALVREPERRSDDDHLVGRLDPHRPVGISRPPRLALERRQALA